MPELMVLLSVEQYDMERRQMVMMNGHRASRFEFINNFQIPEAFVNELFDFCEEIRTEKYCRSIIAILAALTLFSSDRGYPKELDNGKFQFLTHTVYVIRYESYLISALRFNICVQKIVQKPDSDWPQNSPYPNRYRYKSRITPEDDFSPDENLDNLFRTPSQIYRAALFIRQRNGFKDYCDAISDLIRRYEVVQHRQERNEAKKKWTRERKIRNRIR